jgi:outer membrane protein TolC
VPAERPAEEASPVPAGPVPVRVTVEECVLIALRNNIEMRRQRLNDRKAELDRLSALAEFLPSLSASGSLSDSGEEGESDSHARSGRVGVSGRTPWGTSYSGSATQSRARDGEGETDSSSTLRAELRQPLLSGGGAASAFYGYRAAGRERLASREDLAAFEQRTAYNVRQTYWTAVKNALSLQANRRALDSADRFMQAAQARFEAERASRLDVSNAEVQRSNREVALVNAETALEDSLDALKEAMDLPFETRLAPVGMANYRPVPRDAGALLREAMNFRPDLAAARRRLEVQRLNLERQRRDSWPTLDLVAGYSVSGSGESTGASHDYDTHGSSVGLELSLPLGMVRRRNDLRKAELDFTGEQLAMHRREQGVERELRALLRDIDAAERTLASFEKRADAAKLSAEAAQALYERGRGSSFDAVRAQDDLLDAELGLTRSRIECVTLTARLELAVGRPVRPPAGEPEAKPESGAAGGR